MKLDLDIFGVEGKPTTETFTLTVAKREWQGLVDGIFKHCRGHEPREACSQDERALETIEQMLGHQLTVGVAEELCDVREVARGVGSREDAAEFMDWVREALGACSLTSK